MESTFKPKHSFFIYALIILYAAPWLYSIINAVAGSASADWKLFWLLFGALWAFAGLFHMKGALIGKISFGQEITVTMSLQRSYTCSSSETVCIFADTVVFSERVLLIRYLSNAPDLLKLLSELSDSGRLHVVYEQHGNKDAGWSIEKNLVFVIGFSVYMMVMLFMRIHPIRLIGIATDSLLLGWALLLPVLLCMKLVQWVREKTARRLVEPKWI